MTQLKLVLPAAARALLEPRLPADVTARWFASAAEVAGGLPVEGSAPASPAGS